MVLSYSYSLLCLPVFQVTVKATQTPEPRDGEFVDKPSDFPDVVWDVFIVMATGVKGLPADITTHVQISETLQVNGAF